MIFNQHSDLEGKHAFLSPSQNAWLNYKPEKLISSYKKHVNKLIGTRLHEWAAETIRLKRLQKDGDMLAKYINDSIGYNMEPEQILKFSDNCFGTADTIEFDNNILRINDLKTGEENTKMSQLIIYAALFFLEYHKSPSKIKTILSIYQIGRPVCIYCPKPKEILMVMNIIIKSDKIINKIKEEVPG